MLLKESKSSEEDSSIPEEEHDEDEIFVSDSEASTVSTTNDNFFGSLAEQDLTLAEFKSQETLSKREIR